MKRPIASACGAAMLFGSVAVAVAEVPMVATDIAPVHSLVAQVMGDLGQPALTVPPGASPHGYAMRPSEARGLAGADLVVWVGAGLEPWLAGPIGTLAKRAEVLTLEEVPGTISHPVREMAVFAESGHAEPSDTGGEPDGADHADDGNGHAHGDDHDHDDDHAHEGADPHAWLDPENGRLWLTAIAAALSTADPENAAVYGANAAAAATALRDLQTGIAADLAPVQDMRFVVLHDAYQYFEARFGLQPVGAISMSDAADPSAARVAALRDAVRAEKITCIVTQPQFNPSLVEAVLQGEAVGLVELDPIGVGLAPGPELYGALLRGIADGLRSCN